MKRLRTKHIEQDGPFELSSSATLGLILGLVNLAVLLGFAAVKAGLATDTGWLIVLPFLACVVSAPAGLLFSGIGALQCFKSYRRTSDVVTLRFAILCVVAAVSSLAIILIAGSTLARVISL